MLSFVGCFGSGSKTDTAAYQAKEDELKYNSLSDEGKFVLYKASLSDEELEKLKDKKAADLKGEEKEKFEKFKRKTFTSCPSKKKVTVRKPTKRPTKYMS